MATPALVDSDYDSGSEVLTLSGLIDVSGTNKLAIILVGWLNSGATSSVSSVTIGADTFVQLGWIENTDDSRTEIWYKKNPTNVSGGTWTCTFNETLPVGVAGAIMLTFSGVDQSTTFGTFADVIGNGVNPHELLVTCAAGDYLVGTVMGETILSITTRSPATQYYSAVLNQDAVAASYYVAAGSTFTFQWDFGSDYHWCGCGVAIKGTGADYKLEGVTYDKSGSIEVSVECNLWKDNLDNTVTFVDQVTSDGSTGAYSFTGIADNDATYFVVFHKDASPNIFDVTDHVLQPVIE